MSHYRPDSVTLQGQRFDLFLPEEKISERVGEIASELTAEFKGKLPIFIGVLNGACIFIADLIRRVSLPCELDFMKLSSYGDETISSGQITQLKELDADIRGRHVILVEDIVDSGLSMNFLCEKIERIGPADLTTVTLLHKKEKTRYPVRLDYVGFEIPSRFVIGYGLDYSQEGRNLTQIYAASE